MVEATPLWGFLAVLVLLTLTVLSVPIAASMGIVGVLMFILFYGDIASIYLAGLTAWGSAAKYSFSMFPLFVFMGSLISKSGLGADAFEGFYKLMGRLRGGLAMVSTMTCSLFGCVTGSSASTIVAIGGTAIPEMKKYGYDKGLRVGSIAVNGCLANLIPPSLAAVMYCLISETSVARVFIAGLIPGLILTVLLLAVIYIWVLLKPEAAPQPTETFTLREKIWALKTPLPILAIFAFMIVGIYRGFFSPTEAAGMGVVFTVLTMVMMGKFTWRRFFDALRDTVTTFTFAFVILIGAMLFAHTIAISRLPWFIAEHLFGVFDSPIGMIYLVLVVFSHCRMHSGQLGYAGPAGTPVLACRRTGGGMDKVWFGVMVVMMIEMGLLTPPVAGNIYITQLVGRRGNRHGGHPRDSAFLCDRAGIDGSAPALSNDCPVAAEHNVLKNRRGSTNESTTAGGVLDKAIVLIDRPDYAQSSAWSCGVLGSWATSPRTAEGPPWSKDARDPRRNAVVPT